MTVDVVDTRYGVRQPGADAERYRCACLHWGWLGVVTGISAVSTGGVLVYPRSQIPLRYLIRTSFEPAHNQLRAN